MTSKTIPAFDQEAMERMFRAQEIVRERLLQVTSILDQSGIPYAVVGGNAVAYWVSTGCPGAVRGTPDGNILLTEHDFARVVELCASAGLLPFPVEDRQYIRFNNKHRLRSAVWFLLANKKYREADLFATPDVSQSVRGPEYQVIDLFPLVVMKLAAYRTIDRVHLRDLLNVDVINADWLDRIPNVFNARLNEVLDDPFG